MPGWYYSNTINDMLSDDLCAPLRLSFALGKEKARSALFPMLPDCDNCWGVMSYAPVANIYLDPSYTIWQYNNSMQNGMYDITCSGFGSFGPKFFSDMGAANIGPMGGMMGAMSGMGGMGGFGGFNPFGWPQAGGGSAGGGSTQAERVANNEYNNLKTSVQKIANIKGLAPNIKSTLTAALNKSGSIEDKKQAIKDALSTIKDKNVIFKEGAIVDFHNALALTGYNFPSMTYFKDADLSSEASKQAHAFVREFKMKMERGDDDVSALLSICKTYLLPAISCWNDDSSNGNIIEYISKNGGDSIPGDETLNKKVAGIIDSLAEALEHKAGKICNKDSKAKNVDSAQKALSKARSQLDMKGNLDGEQVKNLANAFNQLYAQIRMYEAQEIRNEILTKYGSLNELEKGLIPENIIVDETKKDLEREGIKITNYDIIERPKKQEVEIKDEESALDKKSAKEQVNALVSKKTLSKTDNNNIYKDNDGKYYTIAKDSDGNEKLSEVTGIKNIDSEGKINGEYESVDEAIEANAVTTAPVLPSYIQKYPETMKMIEQLKQDRKVLDSKDGKNYRSRYKDENGNYVDYEISKTGSLVVKGTDRVVTEAQIPDKQTVTSAVESNKERLQRLLAEGLIVPVEGTEGLYKSVGTSNGNIGYHQYFIITPQLGLKKVKGAIVVRAGKHCIYYDGKVQAPIKATRPQDVESFEDSDIFPVIGSVEDNDDSGKAGNTTKPADTKGENAYTNGAKVGKDLNNYTNDEEFDEVSDILHDLAKNDIKKFLEGYYSLKLGDGFFEKLAVETEHFPNKEIVPIMKYALDAVPENKRGSNVYRRAKEIYERYEKRQAEDPDGDFKLESAGWGWDRIWGNSTIEKFDRYIKELLEIDNKSTKTSTSYSNTNINRNEYVNSGG